MEVIVGRGIKTLWGTPNGCASRIVHLEFIDGECLGRERGLQ